MSSPWQPIVFEPYLRPQIWGGRALGERFAKRLDTPEPYGESWEISGHPHHVSIVAEGPHQGKSLTELCQTNPREIFGDSIPADGKFPLLIKLLDCHDLLSVQVHPDDARASAILGDERGKTEAWVVIDSAPTGEIYAGLKPGMDRARFEQHMQAKTTGEALHRFHPKAGDCVFIPAGTVHTMGGGVLIAEVQQTSDATFRIFDWNRVDRAGNSRALHLQESLAAIDFAKGPVAPVVPTPLARGERLVECEFFVMDRFCGTSPTPVPEGLLSIWMMLTGSASLVGRAGDYRRGFVAGETILVPAAAGPLTWDPAGDSSTHLLCITLPADSTSPKIT
jgi:mannose-6-phosphate isomerase